MERVFRLPATTYIGGNEAALPLKEIIRRLEVTRVFQLLYISCIQVF